MCCMRTMRWCKLGHTSILERRPASVADAASTSWSCSFVRRCRRRRPPGRPPPPQPLLPPLHPAPPLRSADLPGTTRRRPPQRSARRSLSRSQPARRAPRRTRAAPLPRNPRRIQRPPPEEPPPAARAGKAPRASPRRDPKRATSSRPTVLTRRTPPAASTLHRLALSTARGKTVTGPAAMAAVAASSRSRRAACPGSHRRCALAPRHPTLPPLCLLTAHRFWLPIAIC